MHKLYSRTFIDKVPFVYDHIGRNRSNHLSEPHPHQAVDRLLHTLDSLEDRKFSV